MALPPVLRVSRVPKQIDPESRLAASVNYGGLVTETINHSGSTIMWRLTFCKFWEYYNPDFSEYVSTLIDTF